MTNQTGRKWGKTSAFLRDVILPHQSDECLQWPFAIGQNGYGYMWHKGKVRQVHRVVSEQVNGPATDGMDAAHKCGNRACCNPAHIRWATRSENNADKLVHGTHDRGERHVNSKYIERQVIAFLSDAERMSVRKAALLHGINYAVASRIKKGQAWPHLSREKAA